MKRQRMPHHRNRRGFTLMEVMLVLIIIVVIAGFGIRSLSGMFDRARVNEAKTKLGLISTSLKEYQLLVGSLPQDLDALHTQPADVDASLWVKRLDKVPLDPWNRPFEYKPNGAEFELRSLGPDGQSGTQDDVVL